MAGKPPSRRARRLPCWHSWLWRAARTAASRLRRASGPTWSRNGPSTTCAGRCIALTQALGKDWLEAGREQLAIHPQAQIWSDAAAFQSHLAACRQHGHAGDETCPVCQPHLAQAAELYAGDFLHGLDLPDSASFDEWLFFQREGFKKEAAHALEHLALGAQQENHPEDGLAFARRWLALDPLHEPAHRLLMRLYDQSGQRSAALRQYEACAQALAKELGVAPQPETTALFEQIKKGAALPTGQAAAPAPALPADASRQPVSNLPHELTPFVGRRQELDEIGALLADPGVRLLTLLGPGGSGKTRLGIQAAGEAAGSFADGVCYVALASLGETGFLLPSIAKALKYPVREQETSLLQQLGNYLRSKDLLLVLDNFEHLISDESAVTLRYLLETASHLKFWSRRSRPPWPDR